MFHPGEPEHLRTQKLLVEGIFVEEATWQLLEALAGEFNLTEKLG